MQDTLIICLVIISIIIVGLLGYLIGKINNVSNNQVPQSFFKKNAVSSEHNNVSIDEKKIVTSINTQGLEKKYSSLGDTKTSEENISSSINKLKTLKG